MRAINKTIKPTFKAFSYKVKDIFVQKSEIFRHILNESFCSFKVKAGIKELNRLLKLLAIKLSFTGKIWLFETLIIQNHQLLLFKTWFNLFLDNAFDLNWKIILIIKLSINISKNFCKQYTGWQVQSQDVPITTKGVHFWHLTVYFFMFSYSIYFVSACVQLV